MRIGVVVTSGGYGRFLHRCLSSLVTQQHVPNDIIVIDDGGEDIALSIAKQYPTSGRSITACNAQVARNTGREMLLDRGYGADDQVMFLDADDWLDKECLQMLGYFSTQGGGRDVTYCNLRYFYQQGFTPVRIAGERMKSKDFNINELIIHNYIGMPSLVRASVMPEFDTGIKVSQDWDYWLTVAEETRRFCFVDADLVNVWVHDISLSQRTTGHEQQVAWEIVKEKHSALCGGPV